MDFKELIDKVKIVGGLLGKLDFAGIKRLSEVDTLFDEGKITTNFTDMRRFFFHVDIPAQTSNPTPLTAATATLPNSFHFNGADFTLKNWQKTRSVCSMVVLKSGKIVHEE